MDLKNIKRIVLLSLFVGLFFLTPVPCKAQGHRFGMGPPVTEDVVAKAVAAVPMVAEGPFEPTWASIEKNYKVPEWFRDGKFGIFMHWGLYSVPAYHNEWYQKHMYGNRGINQWHTDNYGSVDTFGYKDLIPMFTVPKFDPDEWAELFEKSGAKYVIPTAEHHDWFSLWDSDVTQWCAGKMGPKRDLIGELGKAVRSHGMKFGVSNHSIEHYTFIQPMEGLKTDLGDPEYVDFYWVTNHDDANLQRFLEIWLAKNVELIDKYQPDMLWFDNGINHRMYDPLKLKVAAYYYNRAREWDKEVSISTKDAAFLAGSILDFERQGRAPKKLTDYVWQPDDPIGPTFGYTTVDRGKADRSRDMAVGRPGSFIARLVQNVSRNGNYLLNISPRGDGSIPENQQQVLLEIGKWLSVNGEAIYGTRPWTQSEEGSTHFTSKGDTLYAIMLRWPGEQATIASLAKDVSNAGGVKCVKLLGHDGELDFVQDEEGLKVAMPAEQPCEHAFSLKITRAQTQEANFKFDFGAGRIATGYTQVLPTTMYTAQLGYGFETPITAEAVDRGGDEALEGDFCTAENPFYFSVKVPEGNYRVTLTLGDKSGASVTTVKAELRRLMLEKVQTTTGEFDKPEIIVNVRTPAIPGGGQVRLKDREKTSEAWAWDEKLTFEFNGARPCVCAIEIARADNIPTVYLLGDSTVCDQPREPWNSWGQMLPRFLKPEVAVANHAESGESLRSSIGARRIDKVMSLIKPGDYLIVQFGHNDMKDRSPNASDTYKSNLKRLVADVRAKGATPILVTSMERKSGVANDTLRDYPAKVREVAREDKVPLIDLNAMSKVLYKALGGNLDKAFNDGTHHNNYGSYQLVKCVVQGIKGNKLDLARYIVDDFQKFDPGMPDSVDRFDMPVSTMSTRVKPLGS